MSHTGLPSARLLVKVCQVFSEASLPSAPAPASSPVVSWRCWPVYRCWPVVPLFEMCSPRLSLEGNGDGLISPDAHSPGKEGNIKKKKEREGRLKEFAASLSTFLRSWNPLLQQQQGGKKSPFHEFISFGIRSVLGGLFGIKTDLCWKWDKHYRRQKPKDVPT